MGGKIGGNRKLVAPEGPLLRTLVDICVESINSLVSLCLSYHSYTLMVGKIGCILYLGALILGCLGGSVLKVDINGAVKKKWFTLGFGLKVMLGGYLCVLGTCTLQLSCGTVSNLS